MKKSVLLIFLITVIVSVYVFIKYDGYKGMFDFLKKEQTEQIEQDTTQIIVKQSPIIEEYKIDTVYIYRVIIGSFKTLENAQILSDSIPFSDILKTDDGWYRVSKSYYFDKEDAQTERDSLGEDTWVLKDYYSLLN